MTNKQRADVLLKLPAAHRDGRVNEDRWANLIRDDLTRRKGHPIEQRQHSDRAHVPGLR